MAAKGLFDRTEAADLRVPVERHLNPSGTCQEQGG
jgi:hypothetical protein